LHDFESTGVFGGRKFTFYFLDRNEKTEAIKLITYQRQIVGITVWPHVNQKYMCKKHTFLNSTSETSA